MESSIAESVGDVGADSIPQLQKSRSVWQAPCLVLVAIFGSALSLTLIVASKKLKVPYIAWTEAQRKDAVLASASFLPPQGPAMPVQANHFEAFLPPQGPAMPVQANHFEVNGGIKNPFLEHLRMVWAQKKYPPITDADGGSYQGCHRDGPLVWVYFGAICELSACMHRTWPASWTELKCLVCF